MADRHQLPRPVMGRGARFDPDHAWPYRLEEAQHLTSSQLPPHDDRAVCGDTVNLENSLRQIEPDDSDGLHDTAPRRDVPDDDTARTAGQVEVVHTITSRRIIGNYLDLYTAQLTWRLTHTGTSDDDSFAALLGSMMTPGRSPMTGYFLKKKAGGSKRACEIIDENGTPIEWSPPSAEERRKARKEARRARGEVETPRVADARSAKRWREGFEFMSAADFMDDPKQMPLSPGVYGLFLRSGERLCNLAGYFPDPQLPAWDYAVWRNGYVGEGYSLRERITAHLLGGIGQSPFRQSVFAIHWVAGTNELGDLKNREASEAALNDWLRREVVIGYKVCGYHKTVEKEMLKRTAAPLNIRDRDPSPFSRLLGSLRQRFREAVVAAWEPPPPTSRPRQRR